MATSVSGSYNPYLKNYKDAILSMLHEKQNALSSIKLAFGVREYFYYQINDMCYSVGKSNSTFTASSLASYTEAADKIIAEADENNTMAFHKAVEAEQFILEMPVSLNDAVEEKQTVGAMEES